MAANHLTARRWYLAWHPDAQRGVVRSKDAAGVAEWRSRDWRARQLMSAADTVGSLSESGTTVPVSERVARPLTKLKDPDAIGARRIGPGAGRAGAAGGEGTAGGTWSDPRDPW